MGEVQAVYFPDSWAMSDMRAWLRKAGHVPLKEPHHVGHITRWRIQEPGQFGRFVTKVLPNGVHLVLGFRT
jgi:hypothetical protein